MPYLEGLLHCVIQIEHGLCSTVNAFRLQEVVKPLYQYYSHCHKVIVILGIFNPLRPIAALAAIIDSTYSRRHKKCKKCSRKVKSSLFAKDDLT